MVAMPSGRTPAHDLLEPCRARSSSSILRRDAGITAGGHEDEVAPGQRDVGGNARAFEAARLFDDLDEDVVADLEQLVDRVSFAAVGDLRLADVDGIAHDVVDVQKGVAAEADVDEAGSHAGEDVFDAAFVDGADDFFFAFEVDLGQRSFFEDGDAVLPIVARDEKLGFQ